MWVHRLHTRGLDHEGTRCVSGNGGAMSKRHRSKDVAPMPRAELRAHAHNERHRVNSELHLVVEAVQHGVEPLDVIEPGPAWKPMHHHDSAVGRAKSMRTPLKHWKTKDWKRRKAVRRQRAAAWESITREAS